MAIRFDIYRSKDTDTLSKEHFDPRFKDIDIRLNDLEQQRVSYEAEIDRLKSLNLELIRNAISESLAVVEEQTKLLGLLVFEIENQTITMQQGEVVFSVSSGDLSKITGAGYATMIPQSTPENRMTGVVTDIDVDNGQLTLQITDVNGEGSFDNWFMGVGFLAAGRDGLNYRGDYDSELTYYKNDVVWSAADNASYVAMIDNPGNLASGDWGYLTPDAADIVNKVGITRQVIAGEGLTGGGDLSADRTFNIDKASEMEAQEGALDTKVMTPLRTANAIATIVGAAPGDLDTLAKLAAAIGDDADFATTMATALADKVASTRSINPGTGLSGGGDLSADRTLNVDVASNSQFWSAAAGAHLLDADGVWSAANEVDLGGGSDVTPDMNTFINGHMTLTGNRTLNNPTNVKVGRSGYFRVKQDGSGSRTLSFGSNYKFANNTAPTLSDAANAEDILFYTCLSSTRILLVALNNVDL